MTNTEEKKITDILEEENKEIPVEEADLEKHSCEELEAAELRILDLESQINFLEKEVKELNKNKEEFVKTQNKNFVELIEKKSKEAAEILKTKEIQLAEKLNSEFSLKKDFIYESQFSSLVEIVSQFEKIISFPAANPELANYLAGFQMFVSQFKNLFTEMHINEIVPKIGEDFNSEFMQAVTTIPATENEKNKIVEVFCNGYKLKSRIIKLAEVKVGI